MISCEPARESGNRNRAPQACVPAYDRPVTLPFAAGPFNAFRHRTRVVQIRWSAASPCARIRVMSIVLVLLWLAFGTIAALLIYDFLVMPGVRERAREEARAEIEQQRVWLEAEVQRLTAGYARLEAKLLALGPERPPAPEPPAAEETAPAAPPAVEEAVTPPPAEVVAEAEPVVEPPAEAADPAVLAEASELADLSAYVEIPPETADPAPVVAAAEPVETPPPAPAEGPAATSILLLLVRHGEAGKAADDAARELTQSGRREVRILSAELHTRAFSPAVVRPSPLRRAQQTAEIMSSALPDPGPIRQTEALSPGAGIEVLFDLLRSEKPGTSVAWVGHQPDMGAFAARLLGHAEDVELPTGSALALRVDPTVNPPTATLEWAWLP